MRRVLRSEGKKAGIAAVGCNVVYRLIDVGSCNDSKSIIATDL